MRVSFLESSKLLAASPTAGKSTLQALLRGRQEIIDTDEITIAKFPAWFEKRLWERQGHSQGGWIADARDVIVAANILIGRRPDDLFITNLWSDLFVKQLLGPNKKLPLYVGRISGERISQLAKLRGAPISVGLTDKWVASAVKNVNERAENVIWLPDNLFLADVVEIGGTSWKISDQGKELLNKDINEVRRINDQFTPRKTPHVVEANTTRPLTSIWL